MSLPAALQQLQRSSSLLREGGQACSSQHTHTFKGCVRWVRFGITGHQQIARRHSVGSAALMRCVTTPRAGSVLGEPPREVCLAVPCDTELRDLQVFLARAQCAFSAEMSVVDAAGLGISDMCTYTCIFTCATQTCFTSMLLPSN